MVMSESGRLLIHELAGLKSLSAVQDYAVVREDGMIMLHNLSAPEPFAALIQALGQSCDGLPLSGRFPRFRHFILSRESGENLLIIPMGNYYLGFIQSSLISSRQAASDVMAFIEDVLA